MSLRKLINIGNGKLFSTCIFLDIACHKLRHKIHQMRHQHNQLKEISYILTLCKTHLTYGYAPETGIDQSGLSKLERLHCPDANVCYIGRKGR